MPADGLLEVGRIGRAHGVRGDVFVHLTTDRVERLAVGSRLKAGDRWLTVTARQPSQRPLAGPLRGRRRPQRGRGPGQRSCSLAEPIDDPDVLWVHQLIGAEVVEATALAAGGASRSSTTRPPTCSSSSPARSCRRRSCVSVADGVVTIDPPDGAVRARRVTAGRADRRLHAVPGHRSTGSARRACSARRARAGCSTCGCTIRATTPPTCTAPSTTLRSAVGRGC